MDKRAIGVFDSGLGGLTAVRRLHALMPQENIIYFGDTIREAFTRTEMVETEQIQIPSFCLLIFIAIPLFVLFDRWMRKRYYKHHS